MKKLILFSLIALLISSCMPTQDGQVPQNPLLSTLERKSGLIAYIGADGNMYVSDQGGGKLKQLTSDAHFGETTTAPYLYYRDPTWSKNGKQLAFSGEIFDGKTYEQSIFIARVDEWTAEKIYSSNTEYPIYLHWSPDNENLGFISNASTGQNIILQSIPAAGGDRTILDVGAPYYWSWAPSGRTMIVHAGGGVNSTVPEHLAFLQLDKETTEDGLDTIPASFQAPAWSPNGSHIALTRLEAGKNEIIITDSTGVYQQTVGTFELNAAFAWSEEGTKLAYIDGTKAVNGAGILGTLNIFDLETSKKSSAGNNVIAFFWSPNGKKIAYFERVQVQSESSSDPVNAVRLNILEVASGESRELYTYIPTQPFMNILPYFDQYHQSFTIWSPDNNNLVLSVIADDKGTPALAVVAASGQLEPRLLAQGYLGVWSWK